MQMIGRRKLGIGRQRAGRQEGSTGSFGRFAVSKHLLSLPCVFDHLSDCPIPSCAILSCLGYA